MSAPNPLAELGEWVEAARAEGLPHPASVAFVTPPPRGGPRRGR